ncbi:MAG: carbohydrate ABC transporter permease [Acholeplasmataceae bacterium]
MKRLTPKIKLLDRIATTIDAVFVLFALYLTYEMFRLLIVPEVITNVVVTDYDLWGITLTSGQVNTWISILIGYLIVFVPTLVSNIKRLTSKELVEIDEWTYRYQFLLMFMSFFTLNVFSAVLRYIIAFDIKEIYLGYRFKQTMINAYHGLLSLFKKETYQRIQERRKRRKLLSESQQDLERANRLDFFRRVMGIAMTYTFLTLIALFIFIPFYWMVLTSLKTNQELTTALNPRFFIGLEEMQWVNFKIALTRFDFSRYILNTVFVGLATTLGTIITTILAAFAFARLEFKGREFVFSLLLMTMMIPGELYVITNFITIRNLGWYDSFYALIFPFVASVFYIFFLRQTFKQIPDSLYRAAQVDGCGDFKYLARVMVPIARPTIITITILSAIGAWDAYIWPQLVTPSEENWLISVALRSTSFVTGSGSDARPVYNIQLAATALVTTPLLIVFFALKRYIMSGIGRSGTKG